MTGPARRAPLPGPRGPLSSHVIAHLRGRPAAGPPRGDGQDPTLDDDLQLALYVCYELHYGGFDDVPETMEWDPDLLRLRACLEERFEEAIWARARPAPDVPTRDLVPALLEHSEGPSVAAHLRTRGTLGQVDELLVHRSAYLLKEADPHTWAIPRLRGAVKQGFVRIQAGEYGVDGDGRAMHAELFARSMAALGRDPRPNANLELLPAASLAVSNLVSMFGLHRRWRGALVGHLALSEMTSVAAMEQYVAALDRLGAPADVRRFFEVHVLADAEHAEWMAELLDALDEDEPALREDVAFGIAASLAIEDSFARHLVGAWERDESSLR